MKITGLSSVFIALILAGNAASLAADLSKSCAGHGCGPGDNVVTYYSQGSPAVGCPTKQLSLYANYVISVSMLTGSTEAQELTGEDARFLRQIRINAHVADLKAAMKKCWRLKNSQLARIIGYAESGSVRIAPKDGGEPYWTQSNHVDRE